MSKRFGRNKKRFLRELSDAYAEEIDRNIELSLALDGKQQLADYWRSKHDKIENELGRFKNMKRMKDISLFNFRGFVEELQRVINQNKFNLPDPVVKELFGINGAFVFNPSPGWDVFTVFQTIPTDKEHVMGAMLINDCAPFANISEDLNTMTFQHNKDHYKRFIQVCTPTHAEYFPECAEFVPNYMVENHD